MLCLHPVSVELKHDGMRVVQHRRCGQCDTCRLQNQAVWALRIQLEAMAHPASSFVTLTYNDEHLPDPPEVSKESVQKFLKRLRKRLGNDRIRYFAAGEYGDRSLRPHYHFVIFGLASTPENESVIADSWPFGFVHLRELNGARAAYVAKYCTKKLRAGVKAIPDSWQSEFALMSRRPGLGRNIAEALVARLNNSKENFKGVLDENSLFEAWHGYLRLGGRTYPVGRYIRELVKDGVLTDSVEDESGKAFYNALLSQVKSWSERTSGEEVEREERRYQHSILARRMLGKRSGEI